MRAEDLKVDKGEMFMFEFGKSELKELDDKKEEVQKPEAIEVEATIIKGVGLDPIIKVTVKQRSTLHYLRKGCIFQDSINFSDNELKKIYADCQNQINLMDYGDVPFSYGNIMKELLNAMKQRKIKLAATITEQNGHYN